MNAWKSSRVMVITSIFVMGHYYFLINYNDITTKKKDKKSLICIEAYKVLF